MTFSNKTVIITGASKGIGAACAAAFYKEGANVALLDIAADSSGITDVRWLYVNCNVADEAQVELAMKKVYDVFGRIDFLVNNAGIQRYGTVTETTSEVWDLVFNVNLRSYFLCSKYALPYMQERDAAAIINVSSVQAFLSQKTVAAYTTAKTAILGLTRSIAVDYAPKIRCVAVCPGTVDTPMLRDSFALSPDPEEVLQECIDMHLPQRIGKPEEIAGLVVFLCGDNAGFITGQAIRIDGGLGITIGGSKR